MLVTEQTPLRRLWQLGYAACMRLLAAYLRRGLPNVSVYVSGSLGSGEPAYGLSDLDLVAVVGGPPVRAPRARERVEARWGRLRHALPALEGVVSVAVYTASDLRDVAGGTCLTYGLDRDSPYPPVEKDGGFLRPGGPRNELYRRIHPGLYEPAGRARKRLAGPRTQHVTSQWPRKDGLLAAWLELQWWWPYSFLISMRPDLHSGSYLCFKLVAESARIWLWLAEGRRLGRRGAIELALRLLPEEEPALSAALSLRDSLARQRRLPISETLGWLVRCGSRIAAVTADEVAPEGSSVVALVGEPDDLSMAHTAAAFAGDQRPSWPGHVHSARTLVPLVDWRARAMPRRADEALALRRGDPADPATIAAAAKTGDLRVQPAFLGDGLLVLPREPHSDPALLRSVQCAVSDPVSFALIQGSRHAEFPNVAGWSARDSARRAVAEHRNWLALWRSEGARAGGALDLLVTAARAALFLETVDAGAPELTLTSRTTLARLAEHSPTARRPAAAAREALSTFVDTAPRARIAAELYREVSALPPYRSAGTDAR